MKKLGRPELCTYCGYPRWPDTAPALGKCWRCFPAKTHIVFYSGGIGSFATAQLVVKRYGPENVRLLFTDTKMEDPDLYRFLRESAIYLGAELIEIADGRDIWQVFKDERYLGNSRHDPCSKILKRQLSQRWVKENYPDPYAVALYIGIDWSEEHRFVRSERFWNPYRVFAPLCGPPYKLKAQLLNSCPVCPPSDYKLQMPHANCFSGETKFICSEGLRTLKEMSGKVTKVLSTNGKWVKAKIRSFGKQKLLKVLLSRQGKEKCIYATADHGWFVYPGLRGGYDRQVIINTSGLVKGQRLASVYGSGASIEPSPFGIAAGIVFGDGSVQDESRKYGKQSGKVTLCGEKAELYKYMNGCRFSSSDIGLAVSQIPRNFKSPPDMNECRQYLMGWLAGYFAADGSITVKGAAISSAFSENLEIVRDVCVRLGVGVGQVRWHEREGFGKVSKLYSVELSIRSLPGSFFIRSKHRREYDKWCELKRLSQPSWRVKSVEETDRFETVYCAYVPGTHAFVLEDNIKVKNCSGGCIKAGLGQFKILYENKPEVYAIWEAGERELREYLGKDVTILKRTIKGVKHYLTLEEFRKELEAGQCSREDELDLGGCGCFLDSSDEEEPEDVSQVRPT